MNTPIPLPPLHVLDQRRALEHIRREWTGQFFELGDLLGALETAQEGIARLDAGGRYVYVNGAEQVMTGYREEDLLGKEWPADLHPEMSRELIRRSLLEVGPHKLEVREQRRDGAEYWREAVIVPSIRNGDFQGFFILSRDTTHRKRGDIMREELLKALQEAQARTAERPCADCPLHALSKE